MDYGLLSYEFPKRYNIGDYFQSLAAKQFLPRVDRLMFREKLNEYAGPKTKMIMNGWYMRQPQNWPPSDDIIPLFIAFHMNTRKAAKAMLDGKGLEYLKNHQPIGCRDTNTLKMLQEKGIDAYLSMCLTLTLGKTYQNTAKEDIYLVDILPEYPTKASVFESFNSFQKSVKKGEIFKLGKRQKLIKKMLGEKITQNAKEFTHIFASSDYPTQESRFELAEKILKRYEKAKLVITSRIHSALPCLAMGTPVIFINGGFGSSDLCRFAGMTDLFHTIEMSSTGQIKTNFDLESVKENLTIEPKTAHQKYLDKLITSCENFIADPAQ